MKTKPIGIFDSGVGGISVLKEIRRLLPKEDIIYLGDIARTPYGTKSAELIKRYSEEALGFLAKKEVKLVVVACNTASSVAILELKERFPAIIDVIEPACAKAVMVTKSKRIGVIGTKRTIESGVYQKRLLEYSPKVRVITAICPLFVPLVEEGWLAHPITKEVAREYLSPIKGKVDTLILGCTHYPFIFQVIKEVIGEKVEIVTSSEATALVCHQYLKEKNMLSEEGGDIRFCTTDEPSSFIEIASSFLRMDIERVERVEI